MGTKKAQTHHKTDTFFSISEIKERVRKSPIRAVHSSVLNSMVYCKAPSAAAAAQNMDIIRSDDVTLGEKSQAITAMIHLYLCDESGAPFMTEEQITDLGLSFRDLRDLLNELTDGYHKEDDAGNA